jgi:hypothetical protein
VVGAGGFKSTTVKKERRGEVGSGEGGQPTTRRARMADQTPGWWRVDGHTFTALQQSVTDFHAVLAWLLHPPRSQERVEAFARVFPIVAQLEALLAAIVQEKVPEAGEYLDAIHAAIQQIHANIAAGDITSEDARRILAELDQRRERMLARAQALADQKKGEEAA